MGTETNKMRCFGCFLSHGKTPIKSSKLSLFFFLNRDFGGFGVKKHNTIGKENHCQLQDDGEDGTVFDMALYMYIIIIVIKIIINNNIYIYYIIYMYDIIYILYYIILYYTI